MGCESTLSRGKYCTRSRRADGRVVRDYDGSGDAAFRIAAIGACKRQEREPWASQAQTESTDVETIVAKAFKETETTLRAALEAAGYHLHARGEWRKRRAHKDDTE